MRDTPMDIAPSSASSSSAVAQGHPPSSSASSTISSASSMTAPPAYTATANNASASSSAAPPSAALFRSHSEYSPSTPAARIPVVVPPPTVAQPSPSIPPPAPPTILAPPAPPGPERSNHYRPHEPFLAHAPPPPDTWIAVETLTREYNLVVRLPGFRRDGITLATRRRRVLHLVADSWESGGGHFERRISFGYDADLAQVRAEFDGDLLRVIIPRRMPSMTWYGEARD
ncbi:uncharacterized protein STEHIDRAFT_84037 [Stereum hirsutum FP-91666 SS1]|uniref:uncharacterized protein n=1 Tax=Stereum hirsutum (strain FP-91666) TaxID=721885 RepID=UPI00044493F8|nr:uncharacterized protein STEHIDRAFT_84037 [Stereum hirsutum FP-91666 SS1]EIM82767.1 hypothetical protein STEHIDRAFT_84037 [Stereum hirsutum FP-91666 SS1]